MNIYPLPHRISQFIIGSSFVCGAALLGAVPRLEINSPQLISWSQAAIAQDVSPDEIKKYAQAYLIIYNDNAMDSLLSSIEAKLGKKPSWPISCHEPDSIRRLNNDEIEAQVVNYCNSLLPQVRSIMDIKRFNAITLQLQKDEELGKKVQAAMMEILKKK